MGVLFGGVSDEDKDEETLDSKFYNELFGYNMGGAGRWISLPLKKKKAPGGGGKKKKAKAAAAAKAEENHDSMDAEGNDGDADEEGGEDDGEDEVKPWEVAKLAKEATMEDEDDPDDPEKTVPFARYNAMLAVQRNTLYMYVLIYPLLDFHPTDEEALSATVEFLKQGRGNIPYGAI